MNSLTVILAVIGLEIITCAVLGTLWTRERKKRKDLEVELQSKDSVIASLVHQAEELARIKAERNKTDKGILDAKTDKDIDDILASIISANNDRVQDN